MMLSLAVLGTPIMVTVAAGQGTSETGTSHDERTMTGPGMDPMQECDFLQNRFDANIPEHASDPNAQQAKDLRAEGGRLCGEGKSDEGVAKLQDALKAIGVSTVED
jgi:hypothetical protein